MNNRQRDWSLANFSSQFNSSNFRDDAIRGYNGSEVRRPDPYTRQSPNDMQEMIYRELEKERIRAQIITEEIVWRQILEEEVRREMAMEREAEFLRRRECNSTFGLSPMQFDSRINFPPFLSNVKYHNDNKRRSAEVFLPDREVGLTTKGFETLSFQRHPIPRNRNSSSAAATVTSPHASIVLKDKRILPAKPETDCCVLKRKSSPDLPVLKRKSSASASEIDAPETSPSKRKKKCKQEWFCGLCQVITSSEKGLNDHLQGRKHKAKEAGLSAPRTGFGTCSLPEEVVNTIRISKPLMVSGELSKKDCNGAEIYENKSAGDEESILNNKVGFTPSDKGGNPVVSNRTGKRQRSTPISAKSDKEFRFWCKMCKVGAHSLKVMDGHKSGKRHLSKLQKLDKSVETTPHAVEVKTDKSLMVMK